MSAEGKNGKESRYPNWEDELQEIRRKELPDRGKQMAK